MNEPYLYNDEWFLVHNKVSKGSNFFYKDEIFVGWEVLYDFLWLKKSDHHFLHVAVKGIDGSRTHFTCGIA